MVTHLSETKTVLVSGLSISVIEAVNAFGLTQAVTFSIQSAIGLLTFVYLLIKIYKELKTKKS